MMRHHRGLAQAMLTILLVLKLSTPRLCEEPLLHHGLISPAERARGDSVGQRIHFPHDSRDSNVASSVDSRSPDRVAPALLQLPFARPGVTPDIIQHPVSPYLTLKTSTTAACDYVLTTSIDAPSLRCCSPATSQFHSKTDSRAKRLAAEAAAVAQKRWPGALDDHCSASAFLWTVHPYRSTPICRCCRLFARRRRGKRCYVGRSVRCRSTQCAQHLLLQRLNQYPLRYLSRPPGNVTHRANDAKQEFDSSANLMTCVQVPTTAVPVPTAAVAPASVIAAESPRPPVDAPVPMVSDGDVSANKFVTQSNTLSVAASVPVVAPVIPNAVSPESRSAKGLESFNAAQLPAPPTAVRVTAPVAAAVPAVAAPAVAAPSTTTTLIPVSSSLSATRNAAIIEKRLLYKRMLQVREQCCMSISPLARTHSTTYGRAFSHRRALSLPSTDDEAIRTRGQ